MLKSSLSNLIYYFSKQKKIPQKSGSLTTTGGEGEGIPFCGGHHPTLGWSVAAFFPAMINIIFIYLYINIYLYIFVYI